MSNPFTLETDNKKFFTNLATSPLDTIYENPTAFDNARRIRNMNDELDSLAKKREELLFKESQMDYIFKKQKPLTGLNDFVGAVQNKNDKKFRVRALLKGNPSITQRRRSPSTTSSTRRRKSTSPK